MSGSQPQSEPLLPFLVAVLGIATFSTMDAAMKNLSIAIGTYNAVFWRTMIGIPLTGVFYFSNRPKRPSAAAIKVHLIRGVLSAAMAVTFFWGLARMPMAEAVALTFIAPILSLFLAGLVLGERIGSGAVTASLLGFAGVVLIVTTKPAVPGQERDLIGAAAVLISALLYAYNIILMRQQALVATPLEVAFSQNIVVGVALGIGAPFVVGLPPASHLPLIAASSVLACASLFLLAWAYRRAEAQHLAPVEYTALIWAAIFGYLVFGEHVRVWTITGAAMIVGGCLIAARAQRKPASPAEAAL